MGTAALAAGVGPGRPPPVISSKTLGWVTAAVFGLSLMLMIVLPGLRNGSASPAGASVPPPVTPQGNPQAVDLNTMTPREAADRLFNRIVAAQEVGDSVEMVSFLPMAVAAYERAQPLDADGSFHLSLLQRLSLDFAGARATAEAVLVGRPDYLLALHAAAEAARAEGDMDAARTYFQRFAEKYDSERAGGDQDYQIHELLLPSMLRDAQEFLAGPP